MFDLFIYQEMRNIRRQHHISKEVILDWSAFVNVQDSHPYVAIGKISAETRRFFVALVMPLSVQILFRPTTTVVLPRNYCAGSAVRQHSVMLVRTDIYSNAPCG